MGRAAAQDGQLAVKTILTVEGRGHAAAASGLLAPWLFRALTESPDGRCPGIHVDRLPSCAILSSGERITVTNRSPTGSTRRPHGDGCGSRS